MENENRATNLTNEQLRLNRIEEFLLDPDKVIFQSLDEFEEAVKILLEFVNRVNFENLETIQGEDGVTPVYGVDYMTPEEIAAFEQFILERIPVEGQDFPSVEQVETYIKEQVAKIPRIKGDRGARGEKGEDGKNGSPDTGIDIVRKLRNMRSKDGLKISDVKGLPRKMDLLNETIEDVERIKDVLEQTRILVPATDGGNTGGAVNSVNGKTGTVVLTKSDIGLGNVNNTSDVNKPISTATQNALNNKADESITITAGTGLDGGGDLSANRTINLDAGSIASLGRADTALQNITGLVSAGSNVTTTGTGTTGDPYIISASGGSGGGQVDTVVGTSNQINVNNTDPENPVLSLASAVTAALSLANSAVQDLADLGITATASEINVLDGITASTAELNYTDGVTSNIQTQLNAKAADNAVVKLTGDQTVAGVKTFSSFPVTPSSAPTTDYQVANKAYADTGTATLQNKTLTNSNNVLGGVTMTLGSDADGDMYYRSSNVLTRLAKGTAGQKLQMNSGATAPEWVTVAGTPGSRTTSTASLTPDASTAKVFEITALDETALTLGLPSNMADYQTIAIRIVATDTTTFTPNGSYKWFTGIPASFATGESWELIINKFNTGGSAEYWISATALA